MAHGVSLLHNQAAVHHTISHSLHTPVLLLVLLQLASKKWGVIGVELRDVPCWYKPKTIAKLPSWTKPTPQPWWEKAPANWNKAMDRRIGNKFQYQNGKKTLEQHCGFNHVCAGFGSENVLCWTFGFLKDFLYFGQFQAATMFHSTSTYCCSCAWCGCE